MSSVLSTVAETIKLHANSKAEFSFPKPVFSDLKIYLRMDKKAELNRKSYVCENNDIRLEKDLNCNQDRLVLSAVFYAVLFFHTCSFYL